MRFRILGRTGLKVSEIGFGSWGIGNTSWIGADDATTISALNAARDAGIIFFDTALVYGRGHSEEMIARVFGQSNEVVIATKVPPANGRWPAPSGVPLREAFPKHHVLDCLQKSLKHLRRSVIDLYQFHVWSDEWATEPEWIDTLKELRRSGLVRFIGISINDHQPDNVMKALESKMVDSVQVIYNVFDQSPEKNLLPYCAQHDLGVIARVPFDEGSLSGSIRPTTVFPAGDFRNRYFGGRRKSQVWERVQRLAKDACISISELPDLALRFCLSNPAVSTVIPGMRTPEHVRSNAAASDRGQLSPDLLQRLGQHCWERNFYNSPADWKDAMRSALRRVSPPHWE